MKIGVNEEKNHHFQSLVFHWSLHYYVYLYPWGREQKNVYLSNINLFQWKGIHVYWFIIRKDLILAPQIQICTNACEEVYRKLLSIQEYDPSS